MHRLGFQVAHRLSGRYLLFEYTNLLFVHPGAPEKAGAFVGVVRNHLENQPGAFLAVAHQLEQKPVFFAQLGPEVGGGRELFELGLLGTVVLECFQHPCYAVFQGLGNLEAFVGQNSHINASTL